MIEVSIGYGGYYIVIEESIGYRHEQLKICFQCKQFIFFNYFVCSKISGFFPRGASGDLSVKNRSYLCFYALGIWGGISP